MNDTAKAEAERDRSDYVAALHREADGYIHRQNWDGLDAVNAELAAQGQKAIPKPAAAKAPAKK